MLKIKIHANWCSDYDIREHFNRCTINGDYTWKDLTLSLHDYDYLVVFNHAINYPHDPRKTICFSSEPITTRNLFKSQGWNPNSNYFRIYDTTTNHNVDKWYISLNYQQLLQSPPKNKIMSGIVSGLRGLQGHEDRFTFLQYLDTLPFFDHYGRGANLTKFKQYKGEIPNKESGLLDYMYTFNCENTYENGYFTEKLLDAILCESLCFYKGCPNVDKFINNDAFIKIDLSNKEAAIDTIVSSIRNNEWEKRIDCIREEKHKLMNEFNPLNIVWKIINNLL